MVSRFATPMQKSLPNQYLQSDMHSAMVAIQSLVNMNNSRYEMLARETQAAIANVSMSDRGINRNRNSMTTMEMNIRPSDTDRGVAVQGIPPADPRVAVQGIPSADQRRRSSVSWDNQPPGSNVKVYDPNDMVKLNLNDKGFSEQPLRSSLKLSSESNAPLYDRPGNAIQLGSNVMMNPAEQPGGNPSWQNIERVGSKLQLFDNPSLTPQSSINQQLPRHSKWQESGQPYDNKLLSADNKPEAKDNKPEAKDNTTEVMYKSQVLVEVKVVFVRVMEIDTVCQQFEAEIYIQARWPESQFAGYTEEQLSEVEFKQCWNPQLDILNIVGYLESDRASMLLRYEPDRVYPILTYMWHVTGVFREIMELQHFPFDVQEISIVISSDRSIRELELVCDYSQLSNVSPRAMQGNQEWTAYRHIDFIRDYNTLETVSMKKHPILVAAAHVKRKLGLYFWNVCVIVILILALSFTTLGVSPLLEDRLIITMTLFLTCIAFKLVVKATLPSLSYLTYLDMYVVFALVYLTLQGIENSIMIHLKKFKSAEKIELYDEIAQGCLIALLVIFHLVFIIYIQVTAFSRQRTMSDKELDFEIAKINLNKKAAENTASLSREKALLAGMDARNGKMRPEDNPLFYQPQTATTFQPPMGNQQGPISVTNPLFNPTQTSNTFQPPMGNQQEPIQVINPLFNPTQASNTFQPPMGNQQGPVQATNPFFNPTQTSNTTQPPMGNPQGPIQVTNPPINPTQTSNTSQPPMGNPQGPMDVTNPLLR